jgi:hypothetical protein
LLLFLMFLTKALRKQSSRKPSQASGSPALVFTSSHLSKLTWSTPCLFDFCSYFLRMGFFLSLGREAKT